MSETGMAFHACIALFMLAMATCPNTKEPGVTYEASFGARLLFLAISLAVAYPILFQK